MKLVTALKTASFLVLGGALLIASLFIGLMIATAGGAVYPPLIKVAAPFVCEGEFVVESRRYSRGPGHTGVQRNFFCVNSQTGARQEVTLYAVFIAFLVYSGIIFGAGLLVIVPLVFILGKLGKRGAGGTQTGWPQNFAPNLRPASGPGAAPRSTAITQTKIIFNGREYKSADEMPPEARAAYEQAMSVFTDADRNGIPDIFEGKINPAARPSPPPSGESADPAERLRKLKELFDSGLITEQEYEAKRAEILSQM